VQSDGAALRRIIARDHVQGRGLAATVGPDQPVQLTGSDFEVETVDRTHSAKTQRYLIERQGAGIWHRIKQSRDEVGPRHDRAVALERTPVFEIEQLGDSTRDRKYDDEQQRRIEKGGPRDEWRCELRQHGQQDRAEEGPEDGAAAADQDRNEE